mmetsp:Transcript_23692/g.23581  ORF Transcript_23692/g.23581 Transcript_23692/m.23581 type:complete len:168 (-) Transcript_23692:916-1419(-)
MKMLLLELLSQFWPVALVRRLVRTRQRGACEEARGERGGLTLVHPEESQAPTNSQNQSKKIVTQIVTKEKELNRKDLLPFLLNKKKLVFLSCRVYEKAREHCITNGTQIAKEILEESRKYNLNFDFKNVQRRVYDALNVLTALDMIKKDRNKIEFIRDVNEVFGNGK